MTPYDPVDLFAVSEKLDVQELDIGNGDRVLVVDGFYQYPDRVRNLVLDTPSPIWKHTGSGKNGQEYWDCRHQWLFYDIPPFIEAIVRIIENNLKTKVDLDKTARSFTTNVFQWIVDQPSGSVGNVAHFDGVKIVAANIYLNSPAEEHGGTAIYRSKHTKENRIFAQDYMEMKMSPAKFSYLGETGGSYYDPQWEDHWEIDRILEMKYNRLVIYPGYVTHGAYHVDNAFRSYPRMTQTCFVDCVEIPNGGKFIRAESRS